MKQVGHVSRHSPFDLCSPVSSQSGVVTAPNPRDAYDRWAAQCDTDANDTRDLNAEVLRKQTVIEEDDAVLGLGRGTGLNTEWLATRVGHVVTTDVCDEMPARARGRLTPDSGTLQTLDVTTPWPFEAVRFDAVVATLVLEHVEEPAPVFQEARRVLREGAPSTSRSCIRPASSAARRHISRTRRPARRS